MKGSAGVSRTSFVQTLTLDERAQLVRIHADLTFVLSSTGGLSTPSRASDRAALDRLEQELGVRWQRLAASSDLLLDLTPRISERELDDGLTSGVGTDAERQDLLAKLREKAYKEGGLLPFLRARLRPTENAREILAGRGAPIPFEQMIPVPNPVGITREGGTPADVLCFAGILYCGTGALITALAVAEDNVGLAWAGAGMAVGGAAMAIAGC